MFDFAAPPRDFSPLLHWEWESFSAAEPEVLRQTLETIEQAHFGGVVLHLPGDWSTPVGLKVQALAQESHTLNLKLWLHVNASIDNYNSKHGSQHLTFHIEDVAREAALHWEPPTIEASEIVCAVAAPLDITGKLDFARALDLTANLQTGSDALPALPGASCRVFIFTTQRAPGLDWMSDGAACELTQQLEDHLTPLLQDEGLSTPGLIIETGAAEGSGELCLPWSPLLPQAFAQLHGYDLVSSLPSLLADTGVEATRVRQDFWTTITTLSQQNFWQPLCRWAQTHHISCAPALSRAEFAPHLQELIQSGDTTAFARTGDSSVVADIAENGLSLRVAASLAALSGCNGPSVEIGRRFGPEATLADKIAHFHNLLHQGAQRGSISSPVSMSTKVPGEALQPYWSQWRQVADYMARCSKIMAQGRAGARIGVLLPTRSEWAHHHPRGHRLTRWVSEDLDQTISLLNSLHYDFILLPEPDLCAAIWRPNAGAAGQGLDMLIVPGATTLSQAAWSKIEEFVESGGKVACFGLLPRWSEQGRDEEFQARVDKATMVNVGELYEAYALMESGGEMPPTIGYPVYREHHSGGRLCAYQPRLNPDANDARLRVRQIMRESLPPDFETQSPHIVYTRRIIDAGAIFFILNTSDEAQHINAHLRGREGAVPHLLDAWKGTARALPVWTSYNSQEGGGAGIELELAAHEARIIWLQEDGNSAARIEHANFEVGEFDGNTARGYARESGQPRMAIREKGKLRWYNGDIINIPPYVMLADEWSAVCPQHPEIEPMLLAAGSWHEQGLPEYSGMVEYSQRITLPYEWTHCRVFLELSRMRDAVEVVINDNSCGVRLTAPYSFEVTPAIVPGEVATVTLRIWNTAGAAFANDADELMPSGLLGPARLVAYPVVEIAVAPDGL